MIEGTVVVDAFTVYDLLPYGAALVAAPVAAYLASLFNGSRYAYEERVKAYIKVLQLMEDISQSMDFHPESPISDKTMNKYERLIIEVDMFGRKPVRKQVQKMQELLHSYGYGNEKDGEIIETKANMREAMLRDIGRRKAIGVAREPIKRFDHLSDEE